MVKKNNKDFEEPRINNEIKGYSNVRLVYNEKFNEKTENDFNIVTTLENARKIANEKELDLIEINSNTNPPILRIANYSKYLYEKKKQLKQNKKPNNQLKEIQLSVNISSHDLQIKANKAKEFIVEGNKVKVVLTMKGREVTRREESKKSLYEFITLLEEVAIPESMPKDENNKSLVILKRK